MTTSWRGWSTFLLAAVLAGCGPQEGRQPASRPQPTPAAPHTTSSPLPTPRTTPSLLPTRPTHGSDPRTAALQLGDRGADVGRMQARLLKLGYWLDAVDRVFGETTQQAVFAVQYAAGIRVDGRVGRLTQRAIRRGVRPAGRPTQGRAIELDLARQLLLIVDSGEVQSILHVSTGGGYLYTENGVTARATTPRGSFVVERRADGWVHAPLGWLWRPAYFTGGYAIHGYLEVPSRPASHGCVRVSIDAMNWLWATDAVAVGTRVWIY